jgi:hypothetical protein
MWRGQTFFLSRRFAPAQLEDAEKAAIGRLFHVMA